MCLGKLPDQVVTGTPTPQDSDQTLSGRPRQYSVCPTAWEIEILEEQHRDSLCPTAWEMEILKEQHRDS